MANVSVYDTNTATPTTNLYDKDRLYHTVPSGTLTNGNQYKWLITTNPSSATPVYSKETPFWAYSTPTVVFNSTPTTITAKSYNFTCTYTQAQSVPFAKWKMVWYDITNTIIEDSGWSYSGNISYTFDGFVDSNSYKVKCYVESQLGTLIDTGYYQFLVDYASPNLNIVPDATLNSETGSVDVKWGRAVQITGSYTGATPTYIDNFMIAGNKALSLASASDSVYFENLSIPVGSTIKFVWQQSSFATGPIITLDNGGLILSYSTSAQTFSLSGTSFPSTLYSSPIVLNTNPYLIAILTTKVYIIQSNTLVASIDI